MREQGSPSAPPRVRFGVDRLLAEPAILGPARRVGLLTNDAARLSSRPEVRSRVALTESGIPLTLLFSPEHGIAATGADGSPMSDGVDPATGLRAVSLYGERFAPPVDALRSLDLLLVDLPDVGARFYTYAWTMTHVIDACATAGTPVVVLDRPNPLGGDLASAEGPLVEASCTSFIGRHAIPIRHALTIGELALLWRRERVPAARVAVVTCEGWRREMQWPDTGLAFVPMSPAMPSFESALLYPGTCLFEATNLSVGRDGAAPFRSIAAPWMDAELVAATVSADERSRGVRVRADATAVRLEIVERGAVRPVGLGFALLEAAARYPGFAWRPYPTAANPSGEHHLDRLAGTPAVREVLERGDRLADRLRDVTGWAARVGDVLQYH